METKSVTTWTIPLCKLLPDNIPQTLKDLDRWVVWKWEPKKDPAKKWAKPPRQPSGHFAATNDPSTWSSFDDVEAAYLIDAQWDGIGIVLPPHVVGVDLDNCVVDGQLDVNAQLCVSQLDTYTEFSPSQTGIKMIAAGRLNDDLPCQSRAKGLELYDQSSNRYFTITGQSVGSPKGIHARREGIHFLQEILADPVQSFDPDEAEIAASTADALLYLEHLQPERADDYDEWRGVGMSLRSVSDELFDAWHEWSQRSPKYDSEEDCRRKWASFNRVSGRMLTVHSLKRFAIEDGFRPNRYSTQSVTGDQLCAKVIVRDYIVRNMLVRGEPMVIGGGVKSLKTTVALDLAVSIATATAFLDRFEVPTPDRVMMLSGESGESTIQDNLNQIAKQKGLPTSQLHRLHIGFRLPKLDDAGQVSDLLAELKEKSINIVIIDPLYRSLRAGDDASNVYAMGERLELIAEQIHRAGVTPILLHHFRKQGKTFSEVPELEDLSQAGVAEFARQFVLLKRREQYQQDGKHSLWFRWGGSAGHQGAAVLNAETGTRKDGLKWEVTVTPEMEWRRKQQETRELRTREAKEEKAKVTQEETEQLAAEKRMRKEQVHRANLDAILQIIEQSPGLGVRGIHRSVELKASHAQQCLAELAASKEIDVIEGAQQKKMHFIAGTAPKTEGISV